MQAEILRRNIMVKTGKEGPRHDPYSYLEVTIVEEYGNGIRKIVYHAGLDEFLYVDENGNKKWADHDDEFTFDQIKKMTGYSRELLMKLGLRKTTPPNKCPSCRKYLECDSGYAGETILFCPNDACPESIVWEGEPTFI